MSFDLQAYNRQLVLNIIHHLGPISRTELNHLTDYRPASICAIVKDLLDAGLIAETGHSSNGYGRKRVLLEINRQHLCAIGIAFSSHTATCLLAQIDGTILQKATLEMSVSREELIRQIVELVCAIQRDNADKEILGIGICDPLYDPASYQREHSLLINYAHFNDWVHLHLKPSLEQATGLPTGTYSSVAMPAVAEHDYGVAGDARDFICVELSNGIGSSIYCNGEPVTGAAGVAGELGHMTVDLGGGQKLCYCGKPGCVEASAAYPTLVDTLSQALEGGVFSTLSSRPLTVASIRQALSEEDRLCMYCVKEVAEKIGVVIANAVNLLNPELVVLYGFMLELGDYFLNQLTQAIRSNVLAISGNFVIRISTAQADILPLGAVAQVFSEFLNRDDYNWVYKLRERT